MKKFLALMALSLSFNAHALTIDLVPSSSNVNLGDSLEVRAQISGLKTPSASALGVYDLNVLFDSSRFALSQIVWGDSALGNQLDLAGFGSLQLSDSSINGTINLFELSFDSALDLENLQAQSFTLFSLIFSSIHTGVGAFSLDVNSLGDAYGNNITADTINNTHVNVNSVSVPEPATNFLLLIGLIALGFARIKRQD